METYFSKIRNSQEKRNILEIHEKLRKKIIRRPSLLYVLGLEYKKKWDHNAASPNGAHHVWWSWKHEFQLRG